jgi:hypothetical protein
MVSFQLDLKEPLGTWPSSQMRADNTFSDSTRPTCTGLLSSGSPFRNPLSTQPPYVRLTCRSQVLPLPFDISTPAQCLADQAMTGRLKMPKPSKPWSNLKETRCARIVRGTNTRDGPVGTWESLSAFAAQEYTGGWELISAESSR